MTKPKALFIIDKDKFRIGNTTKGYKYLDYKKIKYIDHVPESFGNGWHSEDKTVEIDKSFFILFNNGYPIGYVHYKDSEIRQDIYLLFKE